MLHFHGFFDKYNNVFSLRGYNMFSYISPCNFQRTPKANKSCTCSSNPTLAFSNLCASRPPSFLVLIYRLLVMDSIKAADACARTAPFNGRQLTVSRTFFFFFISCFSDLRPYYRVVLSPLFLLLVHRKVINSV